MTIFRLLSEPIWLREETASFHRLTTPTVLKFIAYCLACSRPVQCIYITLRKGPGCLCAEGIGRSTPLSGPETTVACISAGNSGMAGNWWQIAAHSVLALCTQSDLLIPILRVFPKWKFLRVKGYYKLAREVPTMTGHTWYRIICFGTAVAMKQNAYIHIK
jgi:hypothetical protein